MGWPKFVATLDLELLRRFDDVIYRLPPVIASDAVIEQANSLISGAGIAYGRNGYTKWNNYVTDVRELAMLRRDCATGSSSTATATMLDALRVSAP